MRVKVRSVEPVVDGRELEEFVVEAGPEAEAMAGSPGGGGPDDRLDDGPDDGGSGRVRRAGTPESTARGAAANPASAAGESPARVVERRRAVTADDLGPNGDVVLDLLRRAGHLTPAECGRLEGAAAWRWWSMTPLPGASMPGARATALLRGRADGRAEAIVALEAAVQAIMLEGPARGRRSRLPACISNAGLAVLVRDLIDSETFETLFGPWREVMHH